ncbi:MAG: hypothetical protein L6V90_09145 [Treponema succinifaciens]|nr:MAG: hypothetical protein L6V90_09145 [Treponema succinifaciens]
MSYRTLNSYLKEKFGCKVYKISLSTGCTCPNRDGTKGTGGCTFCSQGGSGDFAAKPAPIKIQIEEAKKRVDSKFPKSIPPEKRKYIAYFQSYTNTYTDKNITIEKNSEKFSLAQSVGRKLSRFQLELARIAFQMKFLNSYAN